MVGCIASSLTYENKERLSGIPMLTTFPLSKIYFGKIYILWYTIVGADELFLEVFAGHRGSGPGRRDLSTMSFNILRFSLKIKKENMH